jgi:hypothetical protein
MNGENKKKTNIYRILAEKPEGKRPQERPRHRWVDDIKMDLREIRRDGTDLSELAEDKEK